jgi:hypothetical protein
MVDVEAEQMQRGLNSGSLANRNCVTARHRFVLISNFGIQLIYIKHFDKKLMTDIFS